MEKKPHDNNQTDKDFNEQRQDVDKAPGEESGKGEKVSNEDLKGKKVDADPEKESDKPLR